MKRYLVYSALYTVIGVLGCSCASLSGQQTITGERRAEIIVRETAWIIDSVPILRFNVPFTYGYFRLQVEQCSGKTRDGWPRFYIAPINPMPSPDGPLAAYYDSANDVIVFALGNETNREIIVHELLHFLLKGDIPSGPSDETKAAKQLRLHPAEYFQKRCGHVINPPS